MAARRFHRRGSELAAARTRARTSRGRGGAVALCVALLAGLVSAVGSVVAAPPAAAVVPGGEGATTKQYTDDKHLVYRVEDGFDLDVNVDKNTSPLDFEFTVDSIEPAKTDVLGKPTPDHPLYDKTALLTIFAFDVDEEQGEVDEVYLNGSDLGPLKGINDQWSVTTFWVPMYWLKLGPGATAVNHVSINVDVQRQGWIVIGGWSELNLDPGPAPVVMVHGLNGATDNNDNGQNDGWESAEEWYGFKVNALRQGRMDAPVMTDHYGVTVDGPILASHVDAIMSSTGYSHVNMLAHSFGGLTARRYIFDSQPLGKVDSLVMLATPNGGSELATDLCNTQRRRWWKYVNPVDDVRLLGDKFVGHGGDCTDETTKVYQLQQSYVRDVFNNAVRDTQSEFPDRITTDYYTIAGTNGNKWTAGILNGEDDGAVNVESVFWLRPKTHPGYILGSNPNHPGIQRPFALYGYDHSTLTTAYEPLEDAVCLHYSEYRTHWPCANSIGDGGDGIPYEPATPPGSMAMRTAESAAPAPTPEEGPARQVVAAPTTTVPAGATRTIDLPSEGYQGAAVAMVSSGNIADITATLDGSPLTQAELMLDTGLGGWAPTGAPGVLQITNNGSASAVIGVLMYATPKRAFTVSVDHPQVRAGEVVTVTAVLTGATAADTALATFTPANDRQATGTSIPMVTQGNGVFTGTFIAPQSGAQLVDVQVDGAELRTGTALVQVAHDDVRLTGAVAEATVDPDGDGLHDGLLFDIGLTTAVAGTYRVVADVVGADGGTVQSVVGKAALPAGPGAIQMRAEGRQVYKAGHDGPFHLKNVVVTRDDAAFTLEDTAADIAAATPFDHKLFEHDPVSIDARSVKEITPEDVDKDGLYDALLVTASVDSDAAGPHKMNARLTTPAGAAIAEWATEADLVAGANTVTMRFPANAIGAGSFDTAFSVRDFTVYRTADVDAADYLSEALTTARYASNQMEGFPLSPPTKATWYQYVQVRTADANANANTTVAIEPQTTNADKMDTHWTASAANTEAPAQYNVELARDAAFSDIVASRTVPATETKTTFTQADGFTAGHTYWFRVTAQSAGGRLSATATSKPVEVTAQQQGPVVLHAPVGTAYNGEDIPIEMTATCTQGHPCGARLFWRTTPIESELNQREGAALGRGWHKVDLDSMGSAGTVNGSDAKKWAGQIPGGAVTTAGVDYYLEAEDQYAITRVPGTTFVGVDPVPDTNAADVGYWHVHTVNPPVIVHVPPTYAASDRGVPLSLDATCSTGTCQARMYYRTSTGPITDETIVNRNGELVATPNWPSVVMNRTPGTANLGTPGQVFHYTAEIPASYVDTRGVDYFFQVTDGTTQAWSPGTTYEGYFAPVDGMRTGWHHVHVVETPHIVHVPPQTTGYRQPTPITAVANCPALRVCTARLYYRQQTQTWIDADTPFLSAPMSVVITPGIGGVNVATLRGTVPATVADTRGFDYFFSVSDGATTTWWPGTSSVDGYQPVAGTRVFYQHVRVLEPPQIVHVPVGATSPATPVTVNASVTCATEHCDVTLYYEKTMPVVGDAGHVLAMSAVGTATSTPLGRVQTYRAVIPAIDVTTAQLSYYIRANDGYTEAYSPGISYTGVPYIPEEGRHTASFPVRVLEPAHVAHVPPGFAQPGQDIVLNAFGNCANPLCTGTVHWHITGDPVWHVEAMSASRTPGAAGNDVMLYSYTVPAASVTTAGLEHWIEVDDGVVREQTPTWPTVIGTVTVGTS